MIQYSIYISRTYTVGLMTRIVHVLVARAMSAKDPSVCFALGLMTIHYRNRQVSCEDAFPYIATSYPVCLSLVSSLWAA